MISDKKLAANRRNSQKSTGPRTLSGKAIACMNALKHGLCARKPVLAIEDEAEYAQFTADLVDCWRPADADQARVAEQAILAAWQLRRVPHIRTALLDQAMHGQSRNRYAMYDDGYANLSRIDRHQVTLERTLRNALKELREMQAEEEEERLQATGDRLQEEGERLQATGYRGQEEEERLQGTGCRGQEEPEERQNEPTGEGVPQFL